MSGEISGERWYSAMGQTPPAHQTAIDRSGESDMDYNPLPRGETGRLVTEAVWNSIVISINFLFHIAYAGRNATICQGCNMFKLAPGEACLVCSSVDEKEVYIPPLPEGHPLLHDPILTGLEPSISSKNNESINGNNS